MATCAHALPWCQHFSVISPNPAGRAPGPLGRAIKTPWRRREWRPLAGQALLGACRRRRRQSWQPAPRDGGTVRSGTLTAAQAWFQPYLPLPLVCHATAMCRMHATMWQGGVRAPPPLPHVGGAAVRPPCAALCGKRHGRSYGTSWAAGLSRLLFYKLSRHTMLTENEPHSLAACPPLSRCSAADSVRPPCWLAGWLYTRLSRNAMTGPRVAHTAGGKNERATKQTWWRERTTGAR